MAQTFSFSWEPRFSTKEKYQEAAAAYREAIRLKPDLAHAHYNLGMVLLRQNDSKSAQAQFAEAHRLDASLNPPAGAIR
jgi:tetratricopeptide (TPR) repeat protein